ncbi:sensor histidine kinase [Actinomadura rayongensis]|uniref:histidine kinase n=1 Tax=Actinomadura rayongensis TaxID=1429076 RepID=A0A6I4W9P1_9ACTN|nr:ATP-binding protein [Actinomadura rayongensis]MXQ66281.1 hypothetical protein [Actinomadura rayongensis]
MSFASDVSPRRARRAGRLTARLGRRRGEPRDRGWRARLRVRLARRLVAAPGHDLVDDLLDAVGRTGGGRGSADAWRTLNDDVGARLLLLTEQMLPPLTALEADEADEERIAHLYAVDHALARIRRVARDLRVLADGQEHEGEDAAVPLYEVVLQAVSPVQFPDRVRHQPGPAGDAAVPGYAAHDVAMLLAALIDNAVRYSTGPVHVTAHPFTNGSLVVQVADAGVGMAPDRVEHLNRLFAGEPLPVGAETGRHLGFPVAHRLARRHGIGLSLASRHGGPGGGLIAMVTVPAHLLTTPAPARDPAPRPPAPEPAAPPAPPPAHAPDGGLPRRSDWRRGAGTPGPDAPASPPAAPANTLAGFADDLAAFTAPESGGADSPEGEKW